MTTTRRWAPGIVPRRRGWLRMRTFDESEGTQKIESTGRVKVRAMHGLSATVARSVVEAARGHRSSATLTAYDERGRGHRADGRNLLELLLLGAGPGEALTLSCVGDDAPAAFAAIAAALGDRDPGLEEVRS